MTYFRRFAPAALAPAFLIAPAAEAQSFEDLDALEMRVSAALGAGIGEPGGPARPIDRRLKLSACPEPASIEPPALGAATVRCAPLGWRLRVPLVRSPVAAAQAVAAKREPVVRKGDQVEIVAASASFSVSTLGIAEQDGAPGDRIRVRSDRKSAAAIGIVDEDGRVSLPGFK